jgi:AraC family transcriptional regulator
VNSSANSHRFTSQLFTTDLAPKYSAPLVQTEELPDTQFKRVISDRILLEHRFHHIVSEVPEVSTVKAGLVINLGGQYQAERWIDGKFYQHRMQPGDFTVFPAGISYRVAWDRPQELLMVGFDPSLIQQKVLELNDLSTSQLSVNYKGEIFPQHKFNDPLIYQLGLALKTELNANRSTDRLYTESLTDTLLVHLLRLCSSQTHLASSFDSRFERLRQRGLSKTQLQAVIDYIQANIDRNLSLTELASITQLGSHHFSNLFKRSTGLSPYQYVIQQRLDRATELLKNTDRSIVDIAVQTGFANQSHLTTAFRKHLSITPKRYREMSK